LVVEVVEDRFGQPAELSAALRELDVERSSVERVALACDEPVGLAALDEPGHRLLGQP
jgi:hypothetical protein